MSEFKFICPHCGQHLAVPADMLGEKIKCLSCNGAIQLPEPKRGKRKLAIFGAAVAFVFLGLVAVFLFLNSGDRRAHRRIAALDDTTLIRVLQDYPQGSKSAVLVKEELDRRGVKVDLTDASDDDGARDDKRPGRELVREHVPRFAHGDTTVPRAKPPLGYHELADTKPVAKQPPLPEVYHHSQQDIVSVPDGRATQGVIVETCKDGCLTMRLANDRSSLAFTESRYLPDIRGATDIEVKVSPGVGHTALAGLKFRQNCTVDIWKDGTVEVDRNGVTAQDYSGRSYVSKEVDVAGQRAIVMVAVQ